MTYKFKGRGVLQITGKNNMATHISPIPALSISSIAGGNGSSGLNLSAQSQFNAINTINIANVHQGLHSSLFSNDFSENHYKKYEIYEFTEDVLAISCAWKRQRDSDPTQHKYERLTNRMLADSVNNDDRELARNIRDYYSKKLMVVKLRGDKLTPFRNDLNDYVHGDPSKVRQELFPLLFRLPEFYEYDGKIDSIKHKLENRIRGEKLQKFHGKKDTFEIVPILSVKKNNRRMKVVEYWFKEKMHDVPVMINLDPKNPLLHIWDDIFNCEQPMQVTGKSFIKKLDDFEYLSINDYKFIKG